MDRLAVIYVFRGEDGTVYAGQHRARAGHDPRGWPRRGCGPLPDGYTGSGTIWRATARWAEWRILAVLPARSVDVDRCERQAIRVARRLFGDRCVNLSEGGGQLPALEAMSLGAARAHMQAGIARDRERREREEARRLDEARPVPLTFEERLAYMDRRLAPVERRKPVVLNTGFSRRLNPSVSESGR